MNSRSPETHSQGIIEGKTFLHQGTLLKHSHRRQMCYGYAHEHSKHASQANPRAAELGIATLNTKGTGLPLAVHYSIKSINFTSRYTDISCD